MNLDADAIANTAWDVIVVGTGMGGATFGHAMARAGARVLFCERGGEGTLRGDYPELQATPRGSVPGADLLARAGRQADAIDDISGAVPHRFVPYVGAGPGGSSALYGMALERFFPADFAPRAHHPHAADEAALVDAWPVSYAAMAPWYAAAEQLFRVRGGGGTLRDDAPALPAPPPLTAGGADLHDFLKGRGLHPYRLPQACEFVAGCQGCQGYLCERSCKNDSARICLQPALQLHGATLVSGCEVLRVRAEPGRATGIDVLWRGQRLALRGGTVVLAAGALQTPRLLLRSPSPDGHGALGNASDLLGRHLMRHYVDLYALPAPRGAEGFDNRFKEIGCNDFYVSGAGKLGALQSFGRLPPADVLFESMRHDVRRGRWSALDALLPLARPFLAPVLRGMVDGATVLASIVEDLPYAGNRVLPDETEGATLRLHYRLHVSETARVGRMRSLLRDALGPRKPRLIAQAANNERLAHACGTCRFGDDPATSVLDPDCRVHDVPNLLVVDASFFPTSGGTNPALTIAANALRVAARLVPSSHPSGDLR